MRSTGCGPRAIFTAASSSGSSAIRRAATFCNPRPRFREKLLIARDTFDPEHRDSAFEQIVLIGHSLGGLVAQLQVSYSYDILWQQAARRPLDAVRAPPKVLDQLRADFYFDPSPLVKRVVFMATPHHGSSMAVRLVGHAASGLVKYSEEEEAEYRQLMDCNRDVFREELWDKKPTSIELLKPENPLLAAMAVMQISRCVRWHSIIGDRCFTLDGEGSDGIVPVPSARWRGHAASGLLKPGIPASTKLMKR